MDRDVAWVEMVSRVTGAGALLLDAAATPLAAEPKALELLGFGSIAELTKDWTSLAPQCVAWCAAAAQGKDTGVVIEIARDGRTASVQARVFRLDASETGEDRYLMTVAEASAADHPTTLASFARRLGHDLRGPLNAMVLNLDLMRLSVEDGGDDEESLAKRQRYLANLQREIDRMSEALTAAVEKAKNAAS